MSDTAEAGRREMRRVLRLLAKGPAHEIIGYELMRLRPAMAAGYAVATGVDETLWRGERMVSRTITITEAGRQALGAA